MLVNCVELVTLPRNVKKFVNLRHLLINGCRNLTHMPCGFGKLTSLSTLDTFVVAANNNVSNLITGLHELNSLNNLRGHLSIRDLGYAKHIASESEAENLKQKQYFLSLMLSWEIVDQEDDNIVKNMKCLYIYSLFHLFPIVKF